jgi:hypothetical protein
VLAVGGRHVKVNSDKARLKVALVIDVVESVAACTQRCELVDVQRGCVIRVPLGGLDDQGLVKDMWYYQWISLGTRGLVDVLGPRGFCIVCASWEGGVAGAGRGAPLVEMSPDPPLQNLPLGPRARFRVAEEGIGMDPGCGSWVSDVPGVVISTSLLVPETSSSSK